MKIALAQINCHIGNFEYNYKKITEKIQLAEKDSVDLIVFPELAITGYPPLDLLENNDFIDKSLAYLNKIAISCNKVSAIIGAPSRNEDSKGKPLFNSAFFLNKGKINKIFNKALLPNYDIFDEYRYFQPANDFTILDFNGHKIAVTICEDIWNLDNKTLYMSSPMEFLSKQNPDFVINIAASPFNFDQQAERKSILAKNAISYKLPVFYVNHVGAHTDLLFDGGSMILNDRGEITHEMKYFDEDFYIADLASVNKNKGAVVPFNGDENKELSSIPLSDEKIKLVYDGLLMGVKDYFKKSGFKKAILGLSGGLDSALVLVLAVKALGSGNVKALLMPGPFSSDHSINDAVELAENLKVSYDIVSINEHYELYNKSLKKYFENTRFDTTEENLQARIRADILMAYSNKFGYVLLNTSNKSEAAVGYSTMYGDMCGGLSVIGDVYKTDVFKLSHFINKEKEIIPENIINKPPSAELRPDQKDSDSLPEYGILDNILYYYIECQLSSTDIVKKGFNAETVNKVISLVNNSEYKRFQFPPVLRISPKSFGSGRRIPLVAKHDY